MYKQKSIYWTIYLLHYLKIYNFTFFFIVLLVFKNYYIIVKQKNKLLSLLIIIKSKWCFIKRPGKIVFFIGFIC